MKVIWIIIYLIINELIIIKDLEKEYNLENNNEILSNMDGIFLIINLKKYNNVKIYLENKIIFTKKWIKKSEYILYEYKKNDKLLIILKNYKIIFFKKNFTFKFIFNKNLLINNINLDKLILNNKIENQVKINNYNIFLNSNWLKEPSIYLNEKENKFDNFLNNYYSFNNIDCIKNCEIKIILYLNNNSIIKFNSISSNNYTNLANGNFYYNFNLKKESINLHKFNFKQIKKNDFLIIQILVINGKVQSYLNPNFINEDWNKFLIKDTSNNSKRLIISYDLIKKLLIEKLDFYLEIISELDSKYILKIKKYKSYLGYLSPNFSEIGYANYNETLKYRISISNTKKMFQIFIKTLTGDLEVKIFKCLKKFCSKKKLIKISKLEFNINNYNLKNECDKKINCFYEIHIKGISFLDNYFKIVFYNDEIIKLNFNSSYYTNLYKYQLKNYLVKDLKNNENNSINIDCFYGKYTISFYDFNNLNDFKNNLFIEDVDCSKNYIIDNLKIYKLDKFNVENLFITIYTEINTFYNIQFYHYIDNKNIFHIPNQINFGIPSKGILTKKNNEHLFNLFIQSSTLKYHEIIINLLPLKGKYVIKITNNNEKPNNENKNWISYNNYIKIKEDELNLKEYSKLLISIELEENYKNDLINSLELNEYILTVYYAGKKILLRPSIPFIDIISNYFNHFYVEIENWMKDISIYRNLDNKSNYFCIYKEINYNKKEEVICDYKLKNEDNLATINEIYLKNNCKNEFENNESCKINIVVIGIENSKFGIIFNYNNLPIKLVQNKFFNFSINNNNLILVSYCNIDNNNEIYLSNNRLNIDSFSKLYNNMELKLEKKFPDNDNHDIESKLMDSDITHYIYTKNEIINIGINPWIILNVIGNKENNLNNEHISVQFTNKIKEIEKYYILSDYLKTDYDNDYLINNKEETPFLKIVITSKQGALLDIKIKIKNEENEEQIIYQKIDFFNSIILLEEDLLGIKLQNEFIININSNIITYFNIYFSNSDIEYFKIPYDVSRKLYLEKQKPIYLEIKVFTENIFLKYNASNCQIKFFAKCNKNINNLTSEKNYDWKHITSELGGLGEFILNNNHHNFCNNGIIIIYLISDSNCLLNFKLNKNMKTTLRLGDLFMYELYNYNLFYFNNPDEKEFEIIKNDYLGTSRMYYNCGYFNSNSTNKYINLKNNINRIYPNSTNCSNFNGTYTFLIENIKKDKINKFSLEINKPFNNIELFSGIKNIGILKKNERKVFYFKSNNKDFKLNFNLQINIDKFIFKLQKIEDSSNQFINIKPLSVKKIKNNKYFFSYNKNLVLKKSNYFLYLYNNNNKTIKYTLELNKNKYRLIKIKEKIDDYIEGITGNIYQLFIDKSRFFIKNKFCYKKLKLTYLSEFLIKENDHQIIYKNITNNELPNWNNLILKFEGNNTYYNFEINKNKIKKINKNLKIKDISFNYVNNIIQSKNRYKLYISNNLKFIKNLKCLEYFYLINENIILINPTINNEYYNYDLNFLNKNNTFYLIFFRNNIKSKIFEIKLNKYQINMDKYIQITYILFLLIFLILIIYIKFSIVNNINWLIENDTNLELNNRIKIYLKKNHDYINLLENIYSKKIN